MRRFARLLLVTVGFGALGFVMSLVPQKSATGSGGAPVNIVSSVPLTVQGTVAAQQSGTWNVGVTGTPAVSLASGSNVNVSNPLDAESNPAPLVTLDAFQPYEDVCLLDFGGSNGGSCDFRAVPARRRLVIQEVDVQIQLESGLRPIQIALLTPSVGHFFTATFMGTTAVVPTFDRFATHQETRLYVGQNQKPSCQVLLTSTSINGSDSCELSGFLVDVP